MPTTSTGSPQTHLGAIQESLTALGLNPETHRIPVYSYRISILVFTAVAVLGVLAGYAQPFGGLALTGIAWLLLAAELVRPVLARVKTGSSQNLSVTIPARSKEFQKVVIVVPSGGQGVLPATGLSEHVYYLVTLGLGLAVLLAHWLNLRGAVALLPLAFIPMAGLLLLALLPETRERKHSPINSAALTELVAMLFKARPATTTVSLLFSGSASLNSGLLELVRSLKGGPELTYVITLGSAAGQDLQLLLSEGWLRLPADPFVKETFEEVAAQKGITLLQKNSGEFSRALPLKTRKYRTATLLLPETEQGTATGKNLRELLAGFIRRIEE
ncbi:hypothetical protein EDC14_102730 [Hydrogenispora ethanolica]|uniref:Uncharacterized protein n=1 Tax=Hydrogenispora ethanolica TaxID=1082276 RepID=A0A4R1R9D6_HYDET|nr:hypothetical protein [Hydrogenispora ethanolica]TCL62180.1 hypothetical protein EDC14_102730 [Hydrogenispora ethanolica]